MLGGGFDSNIHAGPSDRESSGLAAFGAKLQTLKYFGLAHRLKLTLSASGEPYEETSDVSSYRQEAKLFYGFRPNSRLSFTLSGKAKHRNDSATSSEGETLTRDFQHTYYHFTTGLRFAIDEHQAVRFSYNLSRKDYVDTSGNRESLDWWKNGGRIEYRVSPLRGLRVKSFYSFTFQDYEDEPAGSPPQGEEFLENPEEEHYFHRAGIEAAWKVSDEIALEAGLAYKRKDDRFEDYESYGAYTTTLDVEWSPVARWFFRAEGSFEYRDYDERLSDPEDAGSHKLQYDKWIASLSASYQLSEHLSLFGKYVLENRNTNRSSPETTYRDYVRHRAIAGFSVAY